MRGYPDFFKQFIAKVPSDRENLLTEDNWGLVATQENEPGFAMVLIGLINNHPPCVKRILDQPRWVDSLTREWHWECVQTALLQCNPSVPHLILLLEKYPPSVVKLINRPELLAKFTAAADIQVIDTALREIGYPDKTARVLTHYLLELESKIGGKEIIEGTELTSTASYNGY